MANINKPFITVEDLNTTLLMFKKGLKKEFIVNTDFITDTGKLYSYEFLNIQKSVSNATSTFTIEYPSEFGKSRLWVENYANANITYNNNVITVIINNVTIAPIFNLRFDIIPSTETNYALNDVYVKDYYHQSIIEGYLSCQIFNSDGTLARNTEIWISHEKLNYKVNKTTDNNGVFDMIISPFETIHKGENVFYLYRKINNVSKMFASITLMVYPVFFEFKPASTVYKDSLNDIAFDIFYYKLPYQNSENPTNAILKINNKEYTDFDVVDGQLIFSDVNLYKYYGDTVTLTLILEDTDTQLEYKKDFRVNCEYATFNDVITITNPSPATALVDNDAYTVSAPIDLDNDLKLIFAENAVLSDVIFNVYNDSTFKLEGGVLENCKINLQDGMLELKDMQVRESENPIVSEANTEININTSEFTDNISEDIISRGKLTVTNSKFLKQNVEDLNPLRPAFITVNGETTLNYNEFKILYGEITGNVGMAYVMFSINENAILNTNKGNIMKNNNTFNKQKNKGTINVQFNNKTIDCENSCFTWTVQGTNTVYHNNVTITEE